MFGDSGYRVEEFLDAITSQLDRTQDALRLKAVNRPLTYAIRDFALDLKVFVELDDEGQVRFRSAGADDAGASSVSIGFTTITRPMIEENTITLSEVQSPSLDDLGLEPEEQRSLEKIGVRNAAQLKRLNSSSGEGAVSKFANVPVNRLRAALRAGQPTVDTVGPDHTAPEPTTPDGIDTGVGTRTEPSIRVPRGTRRLRLGGSNLAIGGAAASSVTLEGVTVPVVDATADHLVLDLGNLEPRGRLEVAIGDDRLTFRLDDGSNDGAADEGDPWKPGEP